MENKYLLTYLDYEGKTDFSWFETLEEMEDFIRDYNITVLDKIYIEKCTDLGENK